MIDNRAFSVGGHVFLLEYPEGMLSETDLEPYAPFRVALVPEEHILFSLALVDNPATFSMSDDNTLSLEHESQRITISEQDDGLIVLSLTDRDATGRCRVRMSPDYRRGEVLIKGCEQERRYALDTALMILFAFSASSSDTILVHASVIAKDNKGYMFLGRSGTGKSTHSRLWLRYIGGSELLNDDNPVLRIIDEKAYVYGSPWSGKTRCYVNGCVPLAGIVRLSQSQTNRIESLSGVRAYAALLPSCSCIKWNHQMAEAVHGTLCKIIGLVPVCSLACLPDREAAEICYGAFCESDG